jgi:aminoglycoside phosphotransferase (APT) family kinase protein
VNVAETDAADWHGPVDLDNLAAWMDTRGLQGGVIDDVKQLSGGTQNILLSFRRGDRHFVLRRPPSHPRPGNNETMRREARILGALAATPVPHPRLIAACAEEDVIGAAFYLMESVEGFNITMDLPAPYANDEGMRAEVGRSLVDAIAALARVDYVAMGLGDFGKPDGFLERQVKRWLSHYSSYAQTPEWPGPASLSDVDRVAAWLDRNRPTSFMPGIMHGDYHLANVIIDRRLPRIAAIVDWELATIGDPLLDLGWLLATWPDPDGSNGMFDIAPWSGFPLAEEIVERYRVASTRDLSAIRWYTVLAGFKFGILLEGTFVRACAGEADIATGERLHRLAMGQLNRANHLIDVR